MNATNGAVVKSLVAVKAQARKYSDYYNTFWYVRLMDNGSYQTWAHSAGEIVAEFYCGKAVKQLQQIQVMRYNAGMSSSNGAALFGT